MESHDHNDFKCIEGCVRCCTDRGSPLELTIGDIFRLGTHLSVSFNDLLDSYCEIIWNRIPATHLLIPSIGLIFPCGFLDGDHKCTIYDFRPIHCRLFPEGLAVDDDSLDLYRNSGYWCVDKGISIDKSRGDHMMRLKERDLQELEATASYFENYKYCVEVRRKELERIACLLSGIDNKEKAEKKRELLTGTVGRRIRGKVAAHFRRKLDMLDREFRGKGAMRDLEVVELTDCVN